MDWKLTKQNRYLPRKLTWLAGKSTMKRRFNSCWTWGFTDLLWPVFFCSFWRLLNCGHLPRSASSPLYGTLLVKRFLDEPQMRFGFPAKNHILVGGPYFIKLRKKPSKSNPCLVRLRILDFNTLLTPIMAHNPPFFQGSLKKMLLPISSAPWILKLKLQSGETAWKRPRPLEDVMPVPTGINWENPPMRQGSFQHPLGTPHGIRGWETQPK